VRWTRVPYTNTPALVGPARTVALLGKAARAILSAEPITVLHCRSFLPTVLAYSLKLRHPRLKYIFDFRDFYADGGLAKRTGPSRLIFHGLKALEGPMIRRADRVVCLTERARDLLADAYLPDATDPHAHFQVIPCCADFALFDPARVTDADRHAARTRANLPEGACVVTYLGSLGPDYLLPEMLRFFRQVHVLRPDALLLFVSNNGQEVVDAACRDGGVPPESVRFVSVSRGEVPAFLSVSDLSVVFIRADVSKAGCSPTKVAELLACNVPIVANAGVGDLDTLLDLAHNGSVVVGDFEDATLRAAASAVLGQGPRTDIRDASRRLDVGVAIDRYAQVYAALGV
jgi:glycosyltransferase involved in cell wall biosynthesis